MHIDKVKQNIINFYYSIKHISKDAILKNKNSSKLDTIYNKMMQLIPSNLSNCDLKLKLNLESSL